MRFRIVPYKMNSQSAKRLADLLSEKLGYKVWRGKPKPDWLNICWGYKKDCGYDLPYLNDPHWVRYASDKRLAFGKWTEEGVSHVPWTTDKKEAEKWLNEGSKVLARTAKGQAGSGIQVVEPGEELPEAPLYTRYVPKAQEFRVHVFNGKVICVQEKRKKKGAKVNHIIRSHKKGWVFCYQDIKEPDGLRELAVKAVNALGLDFGGVDIIYTKKLDQLFVLEVNSAPGIEGTSLEAYANEIAAQ